MIATRRRRIASLISVMAGLVLARYPGASAEEVEAARKIIAAFDLPENDNKGVIQIDGRMVERLHSDMARRTVAIADAIAKRNPAA